LGEALKLYDRPIIREEEYKPMDNPVKVSIIIAVLNSPEIVRRQLLHYKKMNLTNDVEIILVDDGSEPPLKDVVGLKNLTILYTNDKRKWTQPAARNIGARQSKGLFCIFTDIDHIISKEVIELAKNPTHDVIRFKREAAILDETGNFSQREEDLKAWGLLPRYFRRGFKLPPHGNSYIFRTGLYLGLGGVDERYIGTGAYPNREEVPLKRKLKILEQEGRITILQDDTKPKIYMFPNGKYCGDKDYNPFGFFHDTSRKNNKYRRREASRRKSNKQKRHERLINNNSREE